MILNIFHIFQNIFFSGNRLVIRFFVLTSIFHFALTATAFSQTQTGGNIRQDTRWEYSGSPYIVTSDIYIAGNSTLIIDPGVRILLNPGVNIYVNGKINASGNAAMMITFTSNPTQTDIKRWGAVWLNTKDQTNISELKYCLFEHGGTAGTGPLVHDGGASHILTAIMIGQCRFNGIELNFEILNKSLRLQSAGAPYFLKNHLEIATGTELTLEQGVVIKVSHLKNINVKGSLSALGKPTSLITFTSITDDDTGLLDTDGNGYSKGASSQWGAVHFHKGSNHSASLFHYCIFKFGGGSVNSRNAMVYLVDSSPMFEGCEFENSAYHGIVCDGTSSPDLGGGYRGSKGKNIFSGFTKKRYALTINGRIDVIAQYNCWGSSNVAEVESIISDKLDVIGSGEAIFRPFSEVCKVEKPSAVELVFPSNNMNNLPSNLAVRWKKTKFADYYRLEVSESASFLTYLVFKYGLIDTVYQLPELERMKKYYWRVKAENELGGGEWSEVRSFTTAESGSPDKTILSSPQDGASGHACEIRLEWLESARSTIYELQVARNSSFTELVHSNSSLETLYEKVVNVKSAQLYYWRVRSGNGNEWGDWSDIRSFAMNECPREQPPSDWRVERQTGENTTIIIRAGITDIPVKGKLERGDAIGVFYDRDGKLICGGMTTWDSDKNTPIAVWGDNYLTADIKDGFARGEPFRFIIWDAVNAREIPLAAMFEIGSKSFVPDSISIVSGFKSLESFSIELPNRKFKFVSSPLAPFNSDMSKLLPESIVCVRSESDVLFNSANSINKLTNWDLTKGYSVYSSKSAQIEIVGLPYEGVDFDADYSPGWHILPYLSNRELSPLQAFSSISGEMLLLVNSDGKMFIPKHGFNQIEKVTPGEGFKAFLELQAKYSRPQSQALKEDMLHSTANLFYKPSYSSTGRFAVYFIESDAFSDGDEVAVADSRNDVIGAGIVLNKRAFVLCWGDNDLTSIKDGAEENEKLTFKLYKKALNREYNLSILSAFNFVQNRYSATEIKFNDNDILQIKANFEGASSIETYNDLFSFNLSPNPADDYVRLEMPLANQGISTLSIYSLAGRLVLNRVIDNIQNSKSRSVDLKSLKPGAYQIVLISGNRVYSKVLHIAR